MANKRTAHEYTTAFETIRSSPYAGPAWLIAARQAAMERFQAVGFPVQRKGNEPWKYTDIRTLASASFDYPVEQGAITIEQLAQAIPVDGGFARMTFVDGRFAPELSNGLESPGLSARPISGAVSSDGALLQGLLTGQGTTLDGFTALNAALFTDGALVEINAEIEAPLHIVFVTTGREQPIASFPRTLIVARPLSRAVVVESYVSAGSGEAFTDAVTDVLVEDGATLNHYHLLLDNTATYHIGHLNVLQRRDCTYNSLVYETGTRLGRLEVNTVFESTGSSANLKGLYVTAGEQHLDNLVSIDHAQPHNTSRLYYKGILDGKSSAVFGGTVFVREGADKTDAHQEDKNLLLSEEAEVNSKPALEIYADDVKAGHGATAGAVADEALFYMQSRGIDGDTAMRLLVQGFASEILDAVRIEPLRLWLADNSLSALPRFGREVQA